MILIAAFLAVWGGVWAVVGVFGLLWSVGVGGWGTIVWCVFVKLIWLVWSVEEGGWGAIE